MLSGCSVLRQEAIQMSCSYQIIELVAKRDQYLYISIISLMFVVFFCFYRLRLLYIYTDFYTSRWVIYTWKFPGFGAEPSRPKCRWWGRDLSLRKNQTSVVSKGKRIMVWMLRILWILWVFWGCSKMASHCQVQIVAGNLCHRAPGACDERLPVSCPSQRLQGVDPYWS